MAFVGRANTLGLGGGSHTHKKKKKEQDRGPTVSSRRATQWELKREEKTVDAAWGLKTTCPPLLG